MTSSQVTILCTGDIHLGRHPTRIPPDLDGSQFSPTAIWQATIEEAIRRDVDLLALTGDIIDRENRYFEAYGALEEGLIRINDAGIATVAVAGNHDFDVFPRLVADMQSETLHLLGADGEWERKTLELKNGYDLHVDGWSFPSSHVVDSPLDDYTLSDTDGPVVGLLHADLDVHVSDYAPVELSSLIEQRVDAWLLGHIHRTYISNESNPLIVYPGSPQPLDPGEPGTHGPWLLKIDEAGTVDAEQLPLATLQYDRLDVDVTDAPDSKAIPPMIRDQLEAEVADETTGALELLLARVRLTGRTAAHSNLHQKRADIESDLGLSVNGTTVRLEAIEVDTRPAVDLQKLAGGESPVAYLAELLLVLENSDDVAEFGGVVNDALAAMHSAHQANAYRELRREDAADRPTREEAIAQLGDQARLLLDELLTQRVEDA